MIEMSQALLREDLLQDTLTMPDLVAGHSHRIHSVTIVILVEIFGG